MHTFRETHLSRDVYAPESKTCSNCVGRMAGTSSLESLLHAAGNVRGMGCLHRFASVKAQPGPAGANPAGAAPAGSTPAGTAPAGVAPSGVASPAVSSWQAAAEQGAADADAAVVKTPAEAVRGLAET